MMTAMWLFSYLALFIPSFCVWNRYIYERFMFEEKAVYVFFTQLSDAAH